MSLTTHLAELRKKHALLAAKVEEAQRNPSVDTLVIRDMKKQKLRLKQEIERLDR